jgi:hypothetical protein
MKGGVIKNNGKSYQTNTSTNAQTYPLGGGVYIGDYAAFTMEGGEISNNGVANQPCSGIFIIASNTVDTFILNGPITIKDNAIGSRSATTFLTTLINIGSGFSSNNPIALDLCAINSTSTFSNFWDNHQLLNALDEGDNTISINSSHAGIFTPVNCYVTPRYPPVVRLDESYGINGSGVVVNLAAAQEE